MQTREPCLASASEDGGCCYKRWSTKTCMATLGEGELGRQDRDGIVEHSEVIAMMPQGPVVGCWLLAISKAPD
jgi:hypothetical protein